MICVGNVFILGIPRNFTLYVKRILFVNAAGWRRVSKVFRVDRSVIAVDGRKGPFFCFAVQRRSRVVPSVRRPSSALFCVGFPGNLRLQFGRSARRIDLLSFFMLRVRTLAPCFFFLKVEPFVNFFFSLGRTSKVYLIRCLGPFFSTRST